MRPRIQTIPSQKFQDLLDIPKDKLWLLFQPEHKSLSLNESAMFCSVQIVERPPTLTAWGSTWVAYTGKLCKDKYKEGCGL